MEDNMVREHFADLIMKGWNRDEAVRTVAEAWDLEIELVDILVLSRG